MSKINEILKEINTSLSWKGLPVVWFFWDLQQVEVKKISTWILSLDLITNGWIPEWRIIEVFWPQASWKTTAAIKFLIEVQNKYPEKFVAFIDVEHALDPEYAKHLWLNIEKLIFSQPSSAEEALNLITKLADSWEVKAIILDSVAQLSPEKELNWEVWDAEMWMRARLMWQGLRKIVPIAEKNECTVFFINQLRESMNPYSGWDIRPWGKALPYAASMIIKTTTKKVEEWVWETTFYINKNKTGVPFKSTCLRTVYWQGFDKLSDIINTWKLSWIITQKWPMYYYWETSWKWETAMREDLLSNSKLLEDLEEVIKNTLV